MIAPKTMIEPVIRGHLVKEFRLNKLQTRLEQFRPDHQGEHATNQEHGKTEPQVQCADILMVRCVQPSE